MTEILELPHNIQVKHIDAFLSEVWHNFKFTRRFRGETAWSDAERYANDMSTALTYPKNSR